ncbi:MAG: amino acid ABC transporter substrate-binding protein, partial [Alphaproteobacteria bacterium]|nr:amino acid ABC transporter substrate-binding protein [Alphaproteobacteria bacterium]
MTTKNLLLGAVVITFMSTLGGAQAAEEIRLGLLMPTSGPAAKSGQETLEAVRFAVELINNKFDIDMPFARTEGLPGQGGAKIKLIV